MKKIIIVDDNEQNLYMLQILLEGHGYQVTQAHNGHEALEQAQADPPDLIISDILMPGMDGFALCRQWKKIKELKLIPFIFYTATYTDPKDEEFALSLGADRFLVKPMEPEPFMEKIEALLANHETGKLETSAAPVTEDEETILRTYNERLIKKLEDKMAQLEASNQQLKRENAERKRAEIQIQQQLRRMAALRRIDTAITSSFNLEIIFNIFLDQVINHLEVDAAAIAVHDLTAHTLNYQAFQGFRTLALKNVQVMMSEGLAGEIASRRHLIQYSNLNQSTAAAQKLDHLRQEDFMAYLGTPVIAKGEIKGVLEVFHRSPLRPDREWLNFFETLAGQLAIAIDSINMFYNLQKSNADLNIAYDSTLEGWAKALELRDGETEGHSRRVTEMTLRLAKEFGVGQAEMVHIRRGVLLHDIGKMAIPDRILRKEGPLTDEEWEIMRQHPTHAFDMLSAIHYLRPALDIPYCHHEKWDGSGYPRGLSGTQIPLAARIFTVVDHWDALLSDRPYRAAWPKEKAVEYLREQSGTFFDPQVVEKFLKIAT